MAPVNDGFLHSLQIIKACEKLLHNVSDTLGKYLDFTLNFNVDFNFFTLILLYIKVHRNRFQPLRNKSNVGNVTTIA